jgi:hypothetical protein
VADRSAFVANEVDCAGLGTPDLPNRQPFAVYPNPTDGRVTLAWNASGEHPAIVVYDLRGQLVHSINTASRQSYYDLNLPPGLYLLNCPEWGTDTAVKLHITP